MIRKAIDALLIAGLVLTIPLTLPFAIIAVLCFPKKFPALGLWR